MLNKLLSTPATVSDACANALPTPVNTLLGEKDGDEEEHIEEVAVTTQVFPKIVQSLKADQGVQVAAEVPAPLQFQPCQSIELPVQVFTVGPQPALLKHAGVGQSGRQVI